MTFRARASGRRRERARAAARVVALLDEVDRTCRRGYTVVDGAAFWVLASGRSVPVDDAGVARLERALAGGLASVERGRRAAIVAELRAPALAPFDPLDWPPPRRQDHTPEANENPDADE
jgi:hypothetical protein